MSNTAFELGQPCIVKPVTFNTGDEIHPKEATGTITKADSTAQVTRRGAHHGRLSFVLLGGIWERNPLPTSDDSHDIPEPSAIWVHLVVEQHRDDGHKNHDKRDRQEHDPFIFALCDFHPVGNLVL